MSKLTVTSIRREVINDKQLLKACFAIQEKQMEVWFRTGMGEINTSAEPFLPVALIPSMRKRWTVIVDGEISAILFQGLVKIQQVMSSWYRKFHRVRVKVATTANPGPNGQRPVAAFFSGGVDSFFTLLQHRNELTHLIFVHGFDLPLEAVQRREQMAENARQVARQLQLELIEVETNLRDFGEQYVSWPEAFFGAGLASVALLLSPRFSRVYIPASVSNDQLIQLGSHPELDHHWGNGQVELVHDGAEFNRSAKIFEIASMPMVKSHLRVCYQPVEEGLNCGSCRKCLWTMLVLESIGCLDSVSSFPSTIDLDALRLYLPTDKHQRDRFYESIRRLEERNAKPELRELLAELLEEGERFVQAAASGTRLIRWLERQVEKTRKWVPGNETSKS